MKRIPTLLVAVVAAAALGTAGAPAASAATSHAAAMQKTPPKCVRGHLHKNGKRDCGKHKALHKGMKPKMSATDHMAGGKPGGGH